MKERAYSKYRYAYMASDVDVYFKYNDSIVYSTGEEIDTSDDQCTEIIIITETQLEEYSSVKNIGRQCRSELLAIQDILSFFTGIPMTVYDCIGVSDGFEPIPYPVQETHFSIGDEDFTSDLLKMLERVEQEPQRLITLLDRWRKAMYLRSESYDADLFYDEAILSFFHILELFGENCSAEIRTKLEDNIKAFLKTYFRSTYLSSTQVDAEIGKNKKAINNLLIGNHLTLSTKIKYFLEKYQLLDDNVAFFVDSMINIRNAIAHGRITHHNKFIWPLSPFFNLAKDSYENMVFLYLLTAVMISRYIGISCWEKEWEGAKELLLPPVETFTSFLDETLMFDELDSDGLLTGNVYHLTWMTIFNHYIKNPKKEILRKIEKRVKVFFMETGIDEGDAPDLFNISLLFADSDDVEIKNRAVENITLIIKNRWSGWSNFKDAYSYLDFYNVELTWYKEFLESGRYLEA